MKVQYRWALLVALSGLSMGCDQATKRIAAATLQHLPPQSYAGDLFRLQYSENQGAFLSMGAGLPEEVRWWLFIGVVGTFLTGLLLFALFSRSLNLMPTVAIGLVLGGGFSNWIDRVLHGNVVIDFMNMGIGPLRTGIFNVADIFLVCGTLVLALSLMRSRPASQL
ncbi:MAG: signal peptidase II [Chloroflexota bacterium]